MPSLSGETRAVLVASLRLNAGQADGSEAWQIFPVVEHIRAFEPEVVLIVGDRGAGKTQLVRALENPDVRNALIRHASALKIPEGEIEWHTGWPLGINGPDEPQWRQFARDERRERDDAVRAWLAYLVRGLSPYLTVSSKKRLSALLNARGLNAEACLDAYKSCSLDVTAALDELDGRLVRENKWIFIAYDELDTLVRNDWFALGVLVRGLVSFWATYARRWRRIRPKVFLRSDFYRHHREIAGADVAKLAANRVELRWSDKNLYGALCKHILNKADENGNWSLAKHFERVIAFENDAALGRIPRLSEAYDAKPFIDRLASEFMGPDKRKGLTFTWLLDHLRDGNDRALPRTLIWLIEFGAERENRDPRAKGGHLLHHVNLRKALDDVSKQYVNHAQSHELPWLAGLETRLQRNRVVPWSRIDLLRLVAHKFEENWGPPDQDARPPGLSPEDVIETLLELGILRARTNERYDVPDLYLAGLQLLRKGGVGKK